MLSDATYRFPTINAPYASQTLEFHSEELLSYGLNGVKEACPELYLDEPLLVCSFHMDQL